MAGKKYGENITVYDFINRRTRFQYVPPIMNSIFIYFHSTNPLTSNNWRDMNGLLWNSSDNLFIIAITHN